MSKKRALLSDSSDDEDLEEQLLSLSKKKTKTAPAPPPPDSDDSDDNDDSDSSTDDGDDDWSADQDGKATKKKVKKKVKAIVKKRAISSSEEEGEINDDDEDEDEKKSDDAQVSSASSSSSDDGSDEELPAFDDGLDENLIGDEEDRQKLEQMTEVEREQELFNRMEKREALKTRREIQSKLHAERKKELKQNKKEKGEKSHKNKDKEIYTGTISGSKEVRRRNVDDKKQSALDKLKEKRLQKKENMDSLIKKKEPLNTREVFSDDDDDDDDDKDKKEGSDRDQDRDDSSDSSDSSDNGSGSDNDEEEEDQFLENLEQLEQVRLSRHKLEQWVHLPFFDSVVTGCYIRMGIGQHEGRAIYRVAEIADVTETPKIYTLGKTKTNKGLKIKHGLQERVFRMEYISNQPFTESEFNKWRDEMKSVELPLPTVKHIKRKSEDIHSSKNYTYKEDDIEGIIKEKAKFRKNPFNYAVKKNNLLLEKAIAAQTKDYSKLESVTTELEDLEDRAVFLDKQRSGNLGNISFINEKNRKTNVYAAEEAVIAESKLERNKGKSPFVRRRTTPQMITKGSALLERQLIERASESAPAPSAQEEPSEPASEIDSLLFSPTVNKKLDSANNISEDSDLFNVHDFDVQIDVSIPESRSLSLTPKPMVGQRDGISRRSLNLDEYKKRKGLM